VCGFGTALCGVIHCVCRNFPQFVIFWCAIVLRSTPLSLIVCRQPAPQITSNLNYGGSFASVDGRDEFSDGFGLQAYFFSHQLPLRRHAKLTLELRISAVGENYTVRV
jgi:hypothetical protein